jgi:putative membrane protein
MLPLYIKALHIIFVVTWFAGLFYIVRLFIYHVEAQNKPEPEKSILQNQYKIMEKRLWYIITWPSAVLAISSGLYLAYLFGYYTHPWLHLKLSLVALLFVYHLYCHKIFRALQQNRIKWSSLKLRMFNEIATLFLIAIVFLVTFKSLEKWYWGVIGFLILGLLFFIIIKIYKRNREKNE